MLLGIPDEWTLDAESDQAFSELVMNPGGTQTQFLPVVLAEEVTVRKQNGHFWADTFVTVVIRGVSELIAKFDKRDLMPNKSANKTYWAGSQIFCAITLDGNNKFGYPLVHDPYTTFALTGAVRSEFAQLDPEDREVRPIGQLVFPPNFLATAERSLYSSVFIDTLTSKALRQQMRPGLANPETYDHGNKFDDNF
jgi:hypothetical protein